LTFVSVISDFIEQKKRELGDLSKKGKKIGEEINQYTFQKKELIQRIQNLILKNESVVEDLSIFSILNKTLLEEYGIDLKKDPRPFTKLLYDYKENGYDMTGIVEEYNKSTNLRLDIIQKESLLQSCENQLIKLQKNIKAHESILDSHRKNWDTYQHLEAMKFGIDELQLLRSTVSEIARNRDMSREDTVAIFFKDVEDNYYNKVKFEDKVNARRNELSTIIAELNSSRQNLSLQPFIGSTLFSLFQKGINEQDIIEINQVFQDSLLLQNLSINNLNDEADSQNADVNSNKEKEKGWKLLIEEMRRYGGIKAAIKDQSNLLDKIKKENTNLIEKVQNLSILYQNAIILINMLNNHYFYYKGFFDHYHKKNGVSIVVDRISMPIIILVHNTPKEGQNSKEKDTKGDTTNSSNNNKDKDKD